MANYVIIGAGAAGLYTAYRLLFDGPLQAGDTVQLYEWSNRPGGRIFTYTFPDEIGQGTGLYAEFGGMRFATDTGFPGAIVQGHVLVQNMIVALNLTRLVVPFTESTQRMYYLRGATIYANDITGPSDLPYGFNAEFKAFAAGISGDLTADAVMAQVAADFAPTLSTDNTQRPAWCAYYASGAVLAGQATPTFPAGTLVQNMGYWNLLYDQLGDEGYDYCADGNGYTSNVINWNAADAMQANNDYGPGVNYQRLNGGYSQLFDSLASQILQAAENFPGSGIVYGQQVVSLAENSSGQTVVSFADPESPEVTADYLFLALPRRALEMIAAGCDPAYMLNQPAVRFYLESSIDQPAIKAVLVFDEAWWAPSSGLCQFPPDLTPIPGANDTQAVGGPTITDLPLRMVYYFGNNVPNGPGTVGGPYALLASYDDMNYSNFWRELETAGDYTQAPSSIDQPLTGPTAVDVNGPLAQTLMKQLAEAHGAVLTDLPPPSAVYFQDWGQDPFGGGYHGWSAHYNICQVMQNIRAPYQAILDGGPNVYIIGSCYSFDQAWVEGAFCTAESVLQDYLAMAPFANVSNYQLICKVT